MWEIEKSVGYFLVNPTWLFLIACVTCRVSNAVALLTPILFLGNERMRVTFGVTAIVFEYSNSIGTLLRYFVSIAKVSPRYCDTL